MTTQIPLSDGGFAVVDAGDLALVSGYRWYAGLNKDRGPMFVASYKAGRTILMHRLILDAPVDKEVDHINGNPMDNRRENLRLCTHAENMRNRRLGKNNKSGFKGVYRDAESGKWRAEVRFDGKKYRCGRHDTAEAAHAAYCLKALDLHGAFARFN